MRIPKNSIPALIPHALSDVQSTQSTTTQSTTTQSTTTQSTMKHSSLVVDDDRRGVKRKLECPLEGGVEEGVGVSPKVRKIATELLFLNNLSKNNLANPARHLIGADSDAESPSTPFPDSESCDSEPCDACEETVDVPGAIQAVQAGCLLSVVAGDKKYSPIFLQGKQIEASNVLQQLFSTQWKREVDVSGTAVYELNLNELFGQNAPSYEHITRFAGLLQSEKDPEIVEDIETLFSYYLLADYFQCPQLQETLQLRIISVALTTGVLQSQTNAADFLAFAVGYKAHGIIEGVLSILLNELEEAENISGMQEPIYSLFALYGKYLLAFGSKNLSEQSLIALFPSTPYLITCDLTGNANVTKKVLEVLFSSCQQLKEIHLQDVEVDLLGLELPGSIVKVNLRNNSLLTDVALTQLLRSCKELDWLDLAGTKVELSEVVLSSKLHILDVKDCAELKDSSFKQAIASCNLQYLDISSTQLSMSELNLGPRLRALHMNQATEVADESLADALSMSVLLDVFEANDTNITLQGLKAAPELLRLSLKNATSVNNKKLMELLYSAKKLESLDLEGVQFAPGMWLHLSPALENLNLKNNEVLTNEELSSLIVNCSALQVLHLEGTTLTLKDVTFPASLHELYLNNNTTLDKAHFLHSIQKCNELKLVNLVGVSFEIQEGELPSGVEIII